MDRLAAIERKVDQNALALDVNQAMLRRIMSQLEDVMSLGDDVIAKLMQHETTEAKLLSLLQTLRDEVKAGQTGDAADATAALQRIGDMLDTDETRLIAALAEGESGDAGGTGGGTQTP